MTRIHCLQTLAAAILACLSFASSAQDLREQVFPPVDWKPIAFQSDVKESIGAFTNIANHVFKPQGPGPFPAVVLMHTCGGIRNPQMKHHAQELLKEGFVVLPVDSFGPRGLESCMTRLLSGSAGIADAYAGLALLSAKPFVDTSRVYQVGYSWGGIVSMLLASPQSAALAGSPARFAATVSNYSSCAFRGQYQLLLKDIDRPLLMLMGGRDEEMPVAPCFPLVDEMKAAGSPLQWHVFGTATHGWDKQGQVNRGYLYDERIANEATGRMIAFLRQPR